MAQLKLGKLPDRKTTTITFTASAGLNALLADYANALKVKPLRTLSRTYWKHS